MGTFHFGCKVENHVKRERSTRIGKMLVDTGSDFTWIATASLEGISIAPEKKGVAFVVANGQTVTRDIGFAIIRVDKHFTIDEVVFSKRGDLQLLGARTLKA